MPKVEKQASSEIAQSRERFEKAHEGAFHGEALKLLPSGMHYLNPTVEGRWNTWKCAERDTRERCAEELEAEAQRLYATGIGSLMDGSATLENMAERIRGKE